MKKIITHSVVCLGAFFCVKAAQAQSLDSTLAKFATNYQPEKTWLHYDKAAYFPGETVWFKAYIVDGLYPISQTKTFYVDWVSDKGEVLSHTVSPMVESSATGQFEIPEDYKGNYIHVKAYTRWMLNFDTAFLYSKDIRVITKNPTQASTKPAILTSLQFFPEGGDAVAGVSNKIAFKAVDQWGQPVKVRGAIKDGKGSLVDSFHSVHDGMGSFLLIPGEKESYTAKWKDEKGVEYSTNLPAIKASGITMQVAVQGSKRYINLQSSKNAPENLNQLHIIGNMNQGMAFKTDVSLAAGASARRIIPTENLPSGILTLTLFDANWNAIAERISFINNHEYKFQPKMEVQHWGLNKRARNEIDITIPDSLQGANLSVAITDAAIGNDTSSNIISHLLLTSDIKGSVHNPAYYFSNTTDKSAQQLDLVMLTNGWRRFKWEDLAKGKLPAIKYPKDTAYLSLSGQVYGVSKSQLTGKESIALFVKEKDSGTNMVLMPLNKDGSFNDPNYVFFDTLRVYYQLKSKLFGSGEAKFMIGRMPAFNYVTASKNFMSFNPFFKDTAGSYRQQQLAAEALRMQNQAKGKMMENITVTAKTKTPVQVLNEKYTKGFFTGDGYQFDLVNDPFAAGRTDIFSYLQGKVAGLQINMSGGTPSLSWRGGTPSVFLDETPVDAEMVSSIPVSDIAFVKVFRPPFMGASLGGSGGAIAIYTRRGDDLQSKPGGLNTNSVAGYTPIKQFYSPNYDRFDKRNEQQDVRTTLYWNPMIITTADNRKAKLIFFNNDVSRSFRVTIEGVSKEGLFTHYEEVME